MKLSEVGKESVTGGLGRADGHRQFRRRGGYPMWTCPKCCVKVDDAFEVCWSCGTSFGGEEDPAFARADDVGPIRDLPWKSEHKEDASDFEDGDPELKLVECYWAREPYEAWFLAGQLTQQGIPATADAYDLRLTFAGFFGLVPSSPYFGPRVRVLAEDRLRAQSWLADYEQRRLAKPRRRR
jgi:hypothetical protein